MDQYDGQLGGLVWLPKIYNGRNRTFFMVSYEKYLDDDPRGFTGSVAAPEFLQGDVFEDREGTERQARGQRHCERE